MSLVALNSAPTVDLLFYIFGVICNIGNVVCEIACAKLGVSIMSFLCFYCYLWTDSTHCSGFSTIDIEQVNTGWDTLLFGPLSANPTKFSQHWNNSSAGHLVSVLDHFVGLALKGFSKWIISVLSTCLWRNCGII